MNIQVLLELVDCWFVISIQGTDFNIHNNLSTRNTHTMVYDIGRVDGKIQSFH